MAGSDPKTLMQLNELSTADERSYFWTVLENVDYRVSLAAILGLITKDRLGLGNVSNTADADKPVSAAQQAKLDQKADIEAVVSNARFDLLVSQLSSYVTKPELDGILIEVNGLLSQKLDATQTTAAIQAAIQPINDALVNVMARLEQIEGGYLTAYIRTTDFNQALQDLHDGLTSEFNTSLLEAIEPFSLTITQLADKVNLLELAFATFAAETDTRLTVLEETTTEFEISVGPNEW